MVGAVIAVVAGFGYDAVSKFANAAECGVEVRLCFGFGKVAPAVC
jgi:hypothetical protein